MQQQQLVVAVIELGASNPFLQPEGGRIADSIQVNLMTNTDIVVVDRITAEAQMSQNQIMLDKLSTDTSYWANIGRQLGAAKIVYGQLMQLNDTTIFADIYVTDLVRNRTGKAVLTYNPLAYSDTTMSEKIKQIVMGLIVRGRPVQQLIPAKREKDTLLWIIAGAVLAGGTVVAAVLFGSRTTASSNDLPAPPDLPPQPPPSP